MAKRKTAKKDNSNLIKKRSKNYVKKPKGFKTLKENEEHSKYHVNHARHGCYEVILEEGDRKIYLTNFKNKKAAANFILAHQAGKVTIDPDTRVPTPDFK